MKSRKEKLKQFLSDYFFWLVFIAVLLVFSVVLVTYGAKFHGGLSAKQSVWGQFGDFLGGTINPILGFMTVMILVATLRVQQKELKDTREAVKENANLIAGQVALLEQQGMENTFFKLLEDLSKDPVFNACKDQKSVMRIFFGVYSIRDMEIDSSEMQARFGEFFSEVPLSNFRYVVIEKVVMLCSVASKMTNKAIHFKLLQTTVGVALLSCIIHHAKRHKENFEFFKNAKDLLRGVNTMFVFDDEVAEAFMNKEKYEKYLSNRDESIKRLEASIDTYLGKRKI